MIKGMILPLEYLAGRDKIVQVKLEEALNMADLLPRITWLYCQHGLNSKSTSGWRPQAFNNAAGGADHSGHLNMTANDNEDDINQTQAHKIASRLDLLEEAGLYMEDLRYTWKYNSKGEKVCWVHLDTKPRAHRIFIPYAGPIKGQTKPVKST